MRGLVFAFVALLSACATPAPQPDVLLEARVQSRDSAGFFLQPDGAFVELSPVGLARFYFKHERDEGDAAIIFDETRHVRLKLDPVARTIGEETPQGWRERYALSDVVKGPAPARTTVVTRYWLEGGGALARDGQGGWLELSKIDGFPTGAPLRELSHDSTRIELADGARTLLIEPGRHLVSVSSSDHGPWLAYARIRAMD